ncbi:MAG: MFS transporter [Bacteroidetes bacterium]|nr:MFS transporter [Bacteroidota bacterium]
MPYLKKNSGSRASDESQSFAAVSQAGESESKKTLRTFAAASFLNDMGSDIIFPIWPLFVTSVLNANMAVLGFLDGLGEALVSLSQAASGYISDRIRRRKVFVWTGYLFGSASRIGYAFSTLWQHLIPFRILDRAGKIRSAPRDAIIADISTGQNRGRNFGLLRTMDNLGAVVGITLCIVLFNILGYKKLFLLAAIPSFIGALLVIFLIKEKKESKIKIFKGISFKDLDRNFRLFLVLSAFFALGSFSYSFLLIFAKDAGFKTGFVPVLYLIATAVASIVSLPFGRLSDRIGRKKVLMFSFILWGILSLVFILLHSHAAIIGAFVIYGLHKGAIEPVQKTFVAELSPSQFRASTLGGFQMVVGLCALPSSFFAGLLWDKINPIAPFCFSLVLTIIAVLLLVFVKEKIQ